ncbi:hypothetical protein NUKP37_08410 [Klebsiella variicola]|uniref:Uncharacterized protein n=2 Tax=Klebsiella/Raoultella group TaxID=2890311 RepID=A0A9P3P435_KLEVA|nr:hypothetical protein B8O08_00750 [Klebsiella variicola]PVZ35415.1 hypothetical protein N438_00187 [Klebsiella sp. GL120222-02]ESN40441.1 hypothetical protein L366_02849 [Klebsiella variicola]PXK14072.1 hypothetical protein DMR09_04355 [Klebsiella variicola]PXM13686.1 hypothetical protein DMS97_01790 [Klebsiella variicola]
MRRRSPHGSFEGGCDGTMVSIEHAVELHALTLRLGEGALVTDRSMPTGLPESAKESGIRREYGNKLVSKKIPNEPLSTAVFDTLTYLLDKR